MSVHKALNICCLVQIYHVSTSKLAIERRGCHGAVSKKGQDMRKVTALFTGNISPGREHQSLWTRAVTWMRFSDILVSFNDLDM